jgi:serine/threonine protein kinase
MTRPSWIGQTLDGRYRIDEILGQGGMSAVYKAYDPNLKRVVALKMIHPHLADDPKFVVRFMEEAAAVAQLRHPNIIQVYDFKHDGDLYYMVQEFVEGETLQDRLRSLNKNGRRMPLREAINYVLNICDAAGYAHKRGVIHRDIKPANIMLDLHGQAILMDFGIVKIAGGEKHTETGAVVGTALYLPPELIVGETPGPRSDEYSLAITLFEAVSGHPPFEADSAMTLMMMHLNDPVPNLRQLRKDVPVSLVEIIAKALSKNREDRYASMADFASALRGVLASLESNPPVATLVDQPAPSRKLEPPIPAASPTVSTSSQSQSKPLTLTSPPFYSRTWFKLGCALGIFGAGLMIVVLVFFRLGGIRGVSSWPVLFLFNPTPTVILPAATLSPSPLPGGTAITVPFFDDPCLAGPGLNYPVLTQLKAGQMLRVRGISPDEVWWTVDNPDHPDQTCWLQRSRSNFSGDLSALPLAEVPPTPEADLGAKSVQITGITIDDQSRYVVEFTPLGFVPALPGTHVHFFFDTFAAEQADPVSGDRLMFGGVTPFTGFTQADRPPEAKQLCALVANPDHSVIEGSGNCFPLP